MKLKSQKDFWSGLMFIVTGLGFALGALNYSFGNSARPGPAYFPFGLGILLAVLGAIVLFKSLTVETPDGDPIGGIPWRVAAIITGSVVMFGILLPPLGMAISLPLLVIAASWAGDEFHLGEAIINAVILTVGSWLIFIKGLGLIIPLWPAFLVK